MGRVNPHGLWVPAFVGQVWEPALLYMRVRVQVELAAGQAQVELAAGAGRDEKFLLQVSKCCAKAHEFNHLKNRKTRGCTKLFTSIVLRTVGLQQL